MSRAFPESEVPRPTSQQDVFGDLLERLRAKMAAGELEAEADEPEREAYVAHAAFERHRDAGGYPRYEDPTDCEGMLRIVDQSQAVWTVICDVCGFAVGVPMQKVDPRRLLELRLARAGLPDGFLGRKFDRGEEGQEPTLREFRRWLREFQASALGLSLPTPALWSAPGRGKTHLLVLTIETLIRTRNVDAVYRSAVQLFDDLQDGIDSAAYEVRWQRACRVPVLAIDDLGAERMTEWRSERLATLVDYRYAHELPLLIATNIPPGRWAHAFGERAASRLSGMVVPIRLEGPDRRAQGVQQTLGGDA